MSSNAVNNINTTTAPAFQQNQNDLYNQDYVNQQLQSTVPKTTGNIDEIKITTVMPNSLDTIGESYTFFQKQADSLATNLNIANNENLATNNLQNGNIPDGKSKEEDIINNENSGDANLSGDGLSGTNTASTTSYPEIPLTANTKKKRSRNPSKIPRPQNCFIIYRREKHQIISAKNPGIANNDISKIIAKMWKEEPPEVKEIYHNRAKEEAKRHMLANPGYKYTPRASKNRRKRKMMNEENKKFENNHPLKHEFDNPPNSDKNHEDIRKWIDSIDSPTDEQSIINRLTQSNPTINTYPIMNPLQTSFEDPLYSSSNSGSLAYSACSSASTSSTNLSVYSWSSNSLSGSNLSRGSSISSINEFPNIQQPASRIYEYDFQKSVQQPASQIYNPYDYKLTQGMNQMHIQQQAQPIVLNVQQPNTTLPMQIQTATTQQLQNPIQTQIPPPMQMQQSLPQLTTQTLGDQPAMGTRIQQPIQATAQPVPGSQGPISYGPPNIPNNLPNGQAQFIAVTNPQIQYATTQSSNVTGIPAYSGEMMYPQYQEVKQMQTQNQPQFYNNISTQIPNMNNQGNFQNIYNTNRDGRPNQ